MSDLALSARSERQIWASPGGSHDKLVRTAGWVLPVSIGVLAAFLVTAPLTMGGDVSFVLDKNKVEVAKERLKIQSALYRGEDGKGQPFTLHAGSAVQKSSAEPIVRIKELTAELEMADGPAKLVANTGRYDMDKEQVMVDGPIAFRAPDGYSLDTHDATVDLKTRKMQSGGAVTGTVRQGTFSANSMSADLENRVVSLDGNARLRIVPRGAR
ncbi:LPS export ABC transporter periplasmic protein LptC [soil metagenome]